VLFEQRFWPLIADGSVTVTFRRWKRRQAIAGNTYRSPGGRLAVTSVEVVDPASITDADARRSGFGSAAELVADLRGTPDLPVYRIEFHLAEDPDPRASLAAADGLSPGDVADIDRRLDRLDKASSHGPWTREVLRLIAERPEVRAADLAASVGRETQPFKLDVRKLKNLGLTLSFVRGYRLSPRGEAYLAKRRVGRDH
jgi:hypothetical protein